MPNTPYNDNNRPPRKLQPVINILNNNKINNNKIKNISKNYKINDVIISTSLDKLNNLIKNGLDDPQSPIYGEKLRDLVVKIIYINLGSRMDIMKSMSLLNKAFGYNISNLTLDYYHETHLKSLINNNFGTYDSSVIPEPLFKFIDKNIPLLIVLISYYAYILHNIWTIDNDTYLFYDFEEAQSDEEYYPQVIESVGLTLVRFKQLLLIAQEIINPGTVKLSNEEGSVSQQAQPEINYVKKISLDELIPNMRKLTNDMISRNRNTLQELLNSHSLIKPRKKGSGSKRSKKKNKRSKKNNKR